jgi:serine phosphatase RsbU (regulator of sigma subunit)/pSer/pThr/pTyr-binding forkhead associated (FHA) protein
METRQNIVPTLQIISGPMAGLRFMLDRDVTIVGRSPECDVVLQAKSVSRKHAAIVRQDGGFLLKDMGSTGGIFVNGRKLTQPIMLQDGDTIRTGEVLQSFSSLVVPIEAGEEAESVLADVMLEIGADGQEPEKLGAIFREAVSCRNSLSEECAQIRALLDTNHVKWDHAERLDLMDEVLKPASSARRMLGEGFHRIVVLDATSGLGRAGVFEVERFLVVAREDVVRAFGLRLDPRSFHIEDLFQMLKDEPRSLFCFAHFELIPIEHLRTVRSFTQGRHRVLLLTRGSRDVATEERLALEHTNRRGYSITDNAYDYVSEDIIIRESTVSGLVVEPEAKLRGLRLISQELGSTFVLNETLDRIFDALFEIFPRAERGFVLLRQPGGDALVPEMIRSRTGPSGELSINKTILNRVLNEGQAILAKDLPRDLPDSEGISNIPIRSLMCVPLVGQDQRPFGIMQVDTRDGGGGFDQDDLALLVAVASQISISMQNAGLHKALVRQREMEQELELARQVMQSLLPAPPSAVPGYEFWAYCEPARQVGGDYYGFFPIGPKTPDEAGVATRWAIAVGDITGKGLPAVMLAAKLAAEVPLLLQTDPEPVHLVERLNRSYDGVLDLYITFLLAELDVATHRLRVVNAGHPCPLIRRNSGHIEEFGKDQCGLPLAITSDFQYQTAETTLAPGETVILYTDGITDAMNEAGELMGNARFTQYLLASPAGAAATGESIIQAVRSHSGGRAQFDDITLVSFEREKSS